MTDVELRELLSDIQNGSISVASGVERLRNGPLKRTDMSFAELDHHRSLRHGIGEVIYGEGKTTEQIKAIAEKLAAGGRPVLITRLDENKRRALIDLFPTVRANSDARTITLNPPEIPDTPDEPFVAILAAGTSDLSVAEEASETCFALGTRALKFYDIGVAGLHRLIDKREAIQASSAIIVVAGMEGALPSVVGGLFGKPIFAVPTSVGYGASFGGIAALLAMLNSCAPGIAVMNIDNGFAAGFAAAQVIREMKRLING